jgi:signal transduction histidine kinase
MKTRRALSETEQSAVAEEALSIVRHDVRNKLAAVRQATFYLQTKSRGTDLWKSDPRFEKFFDLIADQLGAADRLLSEHEAMHALSTRTLAPIDPNTIVERAVHEAALPDTARVERGPIASPPEHRAHGDEHELVLALRCLIENASDAINDRGVIDISTHVTDSEYVFAVVDRGKGITEDEFRMYLRAFKTNKTGARGLGLSIARRIASRHGGSLRLIRSDVGARVELAITLEGSEP